VQNKFTFKPLKLFLPKTVLILFFVSFLVLMNIISFANAQFFSENEKNLSTIEVLGFIGPYPVGFNITVRNNIEFVAGHYFYASQCANIPLSETQSGEHVTFTEPSGAVMHLHFVTNAGTPAGTPLTFYTSTGLQGMWTKGAISLPVYLGFSVVYPGVHSANWYRSITNGSDVAFEAHARQFIKGALSGNKTMTAAAISYPLHLWKKDIRSKTELYANWNQIFTPQYLEMLRRAVPHEMFIHDGYAMAADGAVWFDDKGAVTLEVP
jgi:hypothetical protein